MKKVITYGTYDLLHYGHIRLLERAKALGDYLIVGVTAEGFDMARGKINVQQSLMERMEAVKATGIADEVIVEEYEGQKIDDIIRYDVDVFAIGSDWKGKFDYLNEFCQVVYLERTAGVSSTELRSHDNSIKIGIVGDEHEFNLIEKFERESHFVNGATIEGICVPKTASLTENLMNLPIVTSDYSVLIDKVDAVYIISKLENHYEQIRFALEKGKHVLCESPLTKTLAEWDELSNLAKSKGLVLMDAIRTAFSMAYYRMLLLIKSGRIGDVVSVDASCSSLREVNTDAVGSLCSWGPNAMLPVFQILGTDYVSKQIQSLIVDKEKLYDSFTKISFIYPHAVASIKVGKGVKTEGELVVSGTTGYIYVPAPWWKMDYFEIRREDPTLNKRYFYQLDGEGIRYEIVSFLKAIRKGNVMNYISKPISQAIVSEFENFYNNKVVKL
ncbi:MAG: adenylyltransferase/cytidyltransferase family protein [Prevotella sp.]|nr:adenylyltransferase/cytidyltransferase family protein [Prevotella sp.]